MAGIGNPNNFFDLLEKYGLNIKKRIVYPDHYNFSEFEIFKLIYESDKKDYQIITTEKDYMRIKKFNLEKIKFLNISLNMKYKNEFLKKVISLYDKKS